VAIDGLPRDFGRREISQVSSREALMLCRVNEWSVLVLITAREGVRGRSAESSDLKALGDPWRRVVARCQALCRATKFAALQSKILEMIASALRN
jgi:hypothetical protein